MRTLLLKLTSEKIDISYIARNLTSKMHQNKGLVSKIISNMQLHNKELYEDATGDTKKDECLNYD